jgi:hypothetical protein
MVGTEATFSVAPPASGSLVETVYRPLDTFANSGFNGQAGGDPAHTIAGRQLDFAVFSLNNLLGPPLFTGIDLPLDDSFASRIEQGSVRMFFVPLPTDPEFGVQPRVEFDTVFSPNDFSLQVRTTPEPSSVALFGAAAAGLALFRRRVVDCPS